MLSYANPAPKKKISVASLQLWNVSRRMLRSHTEHERTRCSSPKDIQQAHCLQKNARPHLLPHSLCFPNALVSDTVMIFEA